MRFDHMAWAYLHPQHTGLIALFDLLDIPLGYAEIWGSVPMLATHVFDANSRDSVWIHVIEFKTRINGKSMTYYEADKDLSKYFPDLPVTITYAGPGSYHIDI